MAKFCTFRYFSAVVTIAVDVVVVSDVVVAVLVDVVVVHDVVVGLVVLFKLEILLILLDKSFVSEWPKNIFKQAW